MQESEKSKLMSVLADLDLNSMSNAELFRYLESCGFGDAEGLKSRYRRNSFEFRTVIENIRNGNSDVEITELINREPDYTYILSDRERAYAKKEEEYKYETKRYHFNVPHDWAMFMFGSDYHLDDEGANVLLLVRTIEMFAQFAQTRFISLGDWANFWVDNWSSKLALTSKYTPSDAIDVTKLVAQKMGNKHILSQVGNHDKWITKIGFDGLKLVLEQYSSNLLYKQFPTVFKLSCNSYMTDWIKTAHYYKAGSSMWNPHQSNIKHLLSHEVDVNFTITGHYHWPKTAYGEFPFDNRVIRSLLLGSIKSFDDYALELGLKSKENSAPFAFLFLYDGRERIITDIDEAYELCKLLDNRQ